MGFFNDLSGVFQAGATKKFGFGGASQPGSPEDSLSRLQALQAQLAGTSSGMSANRAASMAGPQQIVPAFAPATAAPIAEPGVDPLEALRRMAIRG
jgi:hypothetical protein